MYVPSFLEGAKVRSVSQAIEGKYLHLHALG